MGYHVPWEDGFGNVSSVFVEKVSIGVNPGNRTSVNTFHQPVPIDFGHRKRNQTHRCAFRFWDPRFIETVGLAVSPFL